MRPGFTLTWKQEQICPGTADPEERRMRPGFTLTRKQEQICPRSADVQADGA
ncbi:hypothetical protein HDC93_001030 [Streptomyces sp. AK010]|nr:hypothetical protein [Streptomyces sp. AK010]